MITFTIPTWNRADKLRVCLESLIEQINQVNRDIVIAIYNNASSDSTLDVLQEYKEKYPNIVSYVTGDVHVKGEQSFKNAFLLSKTEWTWQFGDDDILAENGLRTVLDLIIRKDVEFIHVAEATRANGENRTYFSTLLDLCQGFGFVEMTGFISGNIAKTDKLQAVLNSDDFEIYKDASYSQSLTLLDAFGSCKAAFINAPIIDLQDRNQTEESGQRWLNEQVSRRYVNIADGLAVMREKGKIPKELNADFFRYLTGNLFGKIMYNFYEFSLHSNKNIEQYNWDRLNILASFLPSEDSKEMIEIIGKFRQRLIEHMGVVLLSAESLLRLNEEHEKSTKVSYPFTYI